MLSATPAPISPNRTNPFDVATSTVALCRLDPNVVV
jgi:hypothetical protein